MAIERIHPGYYYLTADNRIESVPAVVVGSDSRADAFFGAAGALGYWKVTDTQSYNEMLRSVSELRREKGL